MRGFPPEIVNEVRYYTVYLLRNICWLHLYKALFNLSYCKKWIQRKLNIFEAHVITDNRWFYTVCSFVFIYDWAQIATVHKFTDG